VSAVLHFLPWLRRGLVRSLAGSGTVEATLSVAGGTVRRTLTLRGPGDVLGLAPGQVTRRDPTPGTRDFEPNYFAAVELSAPDLPWMFTPTSPDANGRLAPWLVLVVVADREGVSLISRAGVPLPVLAITSPAVPQVELPNLAESWAWAHVQASVDPGSDLSAALQANPSAFVARLLCPRRLRENTDYRACLVPAFAGGVAAGLGMTIAGDEAAPAWGQDTASIDLPVYDTWTFRTGPAGDFESLVRRLQPLPLGPDVGVHALDTSAPGGGLRPVPGAQVSLAGALVSPAAPPPVAQDAATQRAMHALFAEERAHGATPSPYDPLRDDPLLGPRAYGERASGAETVPPPGGHPSWLAQANLELDHRAAAGLGAEVVRRHQESLMATAWKQAVPLRAINRLIDWTRLAGEAGDSLLRRRVAPLDDAQLLQLSAPVQPRVAATSTATVAARVRSSAYPSGLVSGAFRRVARRGGTAARALGWVPLDLASRVTRTIDAQPSILSFADKIEPFGLQTENASILGALTGLQSGSGIPEDSVRTARRSLPSRGAGAPLNHARPAPARTATVAAPAGRLMPPDSNHVGAAGSPPAFAVGAPVPIVDERGVLPSRSVSRPAIVFPSAPPSLSELVAPLRTGLAPKTTLSAKLRARVTAPSSAWGTGLLPLRMSATPSFPIAFSDWLAAWDAELLLPGVEGVPDDSIALSEVNAAFVEAFLLGANEALVGEMIWREFPANPRDTWIKRFWEAGTDDISDVRAWTDAALGRHQVGPATDGSLALVVRGALLRRHPETRIYAAPARWEAGVRVEDSSRARKEPRFRGRIADGLTFLGFDLTSAQARGSTNVHQDPGWFFVFEEPPAAPRFGLDVGTRTQAGNVPRFWKNVAWGHLVAHASDLDAIEQATLAGPLGGIRRAYDQDGFHETWGASASAMARITFQRPLRMLVHADQMLPEEG
jgi:hypothetical protein